MTLSPISLFTYNRLSETKKTVEALQRNFLATESDLFIFSDGPKNEVAKHKVEAVRKYLRSISGFKSVTILEAKKNKGLANSIIAGVSQTIKMNGKVIVLEDDLITSRNFLVFMNQALEFYSKIQNVFSISGYSMDLPTLQQYDKDYYLAHRASSWGWGTWLDRWEKVDWEIADYYKLKWNPIQHIKFMRGGADMPGMLRKQMNGKIDSWAIRWCFHQFRGDLYTVFASKSKIMSIGFGLDATHTVNTSRFDTDLDTGEQLLFSFDKYTTAEKKLTVEFRRKFSILNRLKEKLAR